ncbi:MAG: type II toxin-antitoxin system MqsA family antitoxin [Candidatus Omnitrophica bacterium]|nr:type II toxin-antitoxin system MqsA family antitoxin [Candidatus Omnitrophota bacterium]MCB9782669.1 type II toxin-antitoxin system MqsA family antitoxin [Candidatus Omnitrophota bacterium]
MPNQQKNHRIEENPFFQRLKEGLEDGISFAKGEQKDLVTHEVTVPSPAPEFTPKQVRDLRKRLQMTSETFARTLNVSSNTLRLWESGKAKPSSPALRLLQIIDKEPDMVGRILYP